MDDLVRGSLSRMWNSRELRHKEEWAERAIYPRLIGCTVRALSRRLRRDLAKSICGFVDGDTYVYA